ncbi:MAG TPA: sialate O-acetylesterase, partial [Bacteroidales bacterium]|nr:sialate O-acetylesterase [Bacteroidales bacterium]
MKRIFTVYLFILSMIVAQANVVLPSIFADHMVLQQNSEISVWGWGKPYEQISVVGSWNGDTVKTVANNQANWKVTLKTGKAGGPYTLTVKGYTTIVIKDVLLGEVWVCSGQSNMEWSARLGIDNAKQEVANANYPNIRFFT